MRKKIMLLLAMVMILAIPTLSFAQDGITKAQFLKEVFDSAKIEVVAEDSGLQPFVEAAYEKGIILEEEKLKADKPVTKEEAVIILVKVFGERTKVKDITQEMIDKEIEFLDQKNISSKAKPYITYAIKYDMIKKSNRAFYPFMVLTESTSKKMIKDAKAAHEEHFTRAGLSAKEMLVQSDEKLKELKTYKVNGEMKNNVKMNVEGLPDNEEFKQQLGERQNIDVDSQIDMQIENPNKAYVKQVMKSSIEGLDKENAVEIFIDEEIMYQKTDLVSKDKWIKTDMSSVYKQIQVLHGNGPQDMAVLNSEELLFFKDYAIYGADEKIDGKEYYVIHADIDKEAYKRFIEKYAQIIIDASLQQQKEINAAKEEEEIPVEMIKALIEQMLEQMDVEYSYRFYINKSTMTYEKMNVSQTVYMNMDTIMQQLAELDKEENIDLSNVKVEMIIQGEGEFNYHDFDGEVTFPKIKSKDIFQVTE